MVSEQAKQMAEFFASLAARTSKPDLDLATMRDTYLLKTWGTHICTRRLQENKPLSKPEYRARLIYFLAEHLRLA